MRKILLVIGYSLLTVLFLGPVSNVVFGEWYPTYYSLKIYADPGGDCQQKYCTADTASNSYWFTEVGAFQFGEGEMDGNYAFIVTDITANPDDIIIWCMKDVLDSPVVDDGYEQTYEDHEYLLELDCFGETGYWCWFTYSKGAIQVLKENPSK